MLEFSWLWSTRIAGQKASRVVLLLRARELLGIYHTVDALLSNLERLSSYYKPYDGYGNSFLLQVNACASS